MKEISIRLFVSDAFLKAFKTRQRDECGEDISEDIMQPSASIVANKNLTLCVLGWVFRYEKKKKKRSNKRRFRVFLLARDEK